jgi:hypothetical protein
LQHESGAKGKRVPEVFDPNVKLIIVTIMIELIKAEREAVNAFLSNKKRTVYTEFKVFGEEYGDLRNLVALSDAQKQGILALREKYGEKDYLEHMSEVITDADELHDMCLGYELESIDLDTPHYKYRFCRHEMEEDGHLSVHEMWIEMTDEEYSDLLSLCVIHRGLTLNKLHYYHRSLYEALVCRIESSLTDLDGDYMYDHPYLVTMDEVTEDAKQVQVKQNI